MTGMRALRLGLILAVLVAVADQVSKWWILTRVMTPPRLIEITSFFNLGLGWNRGISFGMFGGGMMPPWGLALLSAVIVIGLGIWMWRAEQRVIVIGIGMIIGGAVGNVVDRLQYGAVADFLDFHVMGYHWPTFNVADIAISVGAAVLVLDSLFASPESPTNGNSKSASDDAKRTNE